MLVRHFVACLVLIGLVAGCNQRPARIEAPAWDPDGFTDEVLSTLDKNSDESLDKTELAAAPGLAWGAKYIDTDKDGLVSRDELVARFTLYQDMRLGLTSKSIQLFYQGRPLAGAKVQLVPEFFLADVIEPASGETFHDGQVDPLIAKMDPPGLRAGYYRVVVESPGVKIPAKYASPETTPLGVEVSPVSDDAASYGTIQLTLQSE